MCALPCINKAFRARAENYVRPPSLSRRSVWENLDRGRQKYRLNAVRYVLMTKVKILPYRPPAQYTCIRLPIYMIVFNGYCYLSSNLKPSKSSFCERALYIFLTSCCNYKRKNLFSVSLCMLFIFKEATFCTSLFVYFEKIGLT